MDLHARIAAVLFRLDPVGINFETNTDEYEPEATTIISRLVSAASVADVRLIVDEEFNRWFHIGAALASALDAAAAEIWELWLSSPLRGPTS